VFLSLTNPGKGEIAITFMAYYGLPRRHVIECRRSRRRMRNLAGKELMLRCIYLLSGLSSWHCKDAHQWGLGAQLGLIFLLAFH
jgi:hypothetical protein